MNSAVGSCLELTKYKFQNPLHLLLYLRYVLLFQTVDSYPCASGRWCLDVIERALWKPPAEVGKFCEYLGQNAS